MSLARAIGKHGGTQLTIATLMEAAPGAKKLGIRGNAHGVEQGWFLWPANFDPVWLEACNGFEAAGRQV